MFLAPNVTTLDIWSSILLPDIPLDKLIPHLPIICPELRVLRWDHIASYDDNSEESEAFSSLISSLICRFSSLHTIDIPRVHFNPQAIIQIMKSDHLSSLAWGLDPEELPSTPSIIFQHLRHYHQTHPIPLPSFLTLASRFANPKLETLEIMCSNPRALQLKETFTLLRDHFDHGTLTSITLTSTSWIDSSENDRDGIIDIDVLLPLLSFSNLRTVDLVMDELCWYVLDDESLELVASAWPRIETLGFRSTPLQTRPSKIGLKGLVALARLCPKLLHLDVSVDLTNEETGWLDELNTQELGCCPGLTRWGVGASPIRDGKAQAAIFTRIFPNVQFIRHYVDGDEWEILISTLQEQREMRLASM